MRRRLPAICLLLAGLTLAACSSLPGQSAPPPANTPIVPSGLTGRLAYTRDGGLSMLTLDNAQTRELVPAPELGQVTSARWSPDGSRLLVIHDFIDWIHP